MNPELADAIRASQNDTVRALVRALDLHEPGEGDHAERVSVYAVATGEKMGLDADVLLNVRRAAALHDVGKLSLSQGLLRKLGQLTDEDVKQLRQHATLALEIVESFEWLRDCSPMIRHHHEWWNGDGYPDGLKGSAIPIGARLIAVAETFDVLAHEGGYREKMPERDAMDELKRAAGSQFDPDVVAAFQLVQPLIQPLMGTR